MRMGFSYDEAKHLTLGQWTDLFEEYKKIHNIIATNSTFTKGDTKEDFFRDMEFDGEELSE